MNRNKITVLTVAAVLSLAMNLAFGAGQSEGTYLHRESDTFWLLKSPHQRKFAPGQRFKTKVFLKPVVTFPDNSANNNKSLEIKNARFAIWGAPSENMLVLLRLDYDQFNDRFGPVTSDSTGKLQRRTDNNVADAWIEYTFSKALRVRVGQDVIPYGLNMRTPVSQLTFNNRPRWYAQNFVRNRLIRDLQIQTFGQVGPVLWAAGILQGTGIGGSTSNTGGSDGLQFRLANDNNDKKDFAGRIVWATPVEGLSLGASIYSGHRGDSGDSATDYLATGGITDEKHYGADLSYQDGPLWLSLEYNKSDIDKMIVPNSEGILLRSGKGTLKDLVFSVRYDGLSKWFSPKFRYERFDGTSKKGFKGDSDRIKGYAPPANIYTFGVNVNLPTFARSIKSTIGIEYAKIDELNNASKTGNDEGSVYWAMLY